MAAFRKPAVSRPVSTLAIVAVALLAGYSLAAQANPPPTTSTTPFAPGSYLSSREFVTSITVLAFGAIMTIVAGVLLTVGRQSIEPIIRLFALIIIVSGTLFLVAAGYDANEIAPSMGLLGSIAGYLLGRGSTPKVSRADARQSGSDDG